MTDEERLAALELERDNIHADIGPKQNRLYEIHKQAGSLKEIIAQRQLALVVDPDWGQIIKDLADNRRSSQALLRYAGAKLLERFSMYHSGYFSDTNEACFQLMLYQLPESLKKNVAGVKFFTPLYTPHSDSGLVHFGIFEHSLSAGGMFDLRVKPDLSALTLGITSYGRYRAQLTFKTVEEAVTYIQKNHPYDRGEGYDD